MIKEEVEIGNNYKLINLVNNLDKGVGVNIFKNNNFYSFNILEPNANKGKGKRFIFHVNILKVPKELKEKILKSLQSNSQATN